MDQPKKENPSEMAGEIKSEVKSETNESKPPAVGELIRLFNDGAVHAVSAEDQDMLSPVHARETVGSLTKLFEDASARPLMESLSAGKDKKEKTMEKKEITKEEKLKFQPDIQASSVDRKSGPLSQETRPLENLEMTTPSLPVSTSSSLTSTAVAPVPTSIVSAVASTPQDPPSVIPLPVPLPAAAESSSSASTVSASSVHSGSKMSSTSVSESTVASPASESMVTSAAVPISLSSTSHSGSSINSSSSSSRQVPMEDHKKSIVERGRGRDAATDKRRPVVSQAPSLAEMMAPSSHHLLGMGGLGALLDHDSPLSGGVFVSGGGHLSSDLRRVINQAGGLASIATRYHGRSSSPDSEEAEENEPSESVAPSATTTTATSFSSAPTKKSTGASEKLKSRPAFGDDDEDEYEQEEGEGEEDGAATAQVSDEEDYDKSRLQALTGRIVSDVMRSRPMTLKMDSNEASRHESFPCTDCCLHGTKSRPSSSTAMPKQEKSGTLVRGGEDKELRSRLRARSDEKEGSSVADTRAEETEDSNLYTTLSHSGHPLASRPTPHKLAPRGPEKADTKRTSIMEEEEDDGEERQRTRSSLTPIPPSSVSVETVSPPPSTTTTKPFCVCETDGDESEFTETIQHNRRPPLVSPPSSAPSSMSYRLPLTSSAAVRIGRSPLAVSMSAADTAAALHAASRLSHLRGREVDKAPVASSATRSAAAALVRDTPAASRAVAPAKTVTKLPTEASVRSKKKKEAEDEDEERMVEVQPSAPAKKASLRASEEKKEEEISRTYRLPDFLYLIDDSAPRTAETVGEKTLKLIKWTKLMVVLQLFDRLKEYHQRKKCAHGGLRPENVMVTVKDTRLTRPFIKDILGARPPSAQAPGLRTMMMQRDWRDLSLLAVQIFTGRGFYDLAPMDPRVIDDIISTCIPHDPKLRQCLSDFVATPGLRKEARDGFCSYLSDTFGRNILGTDTLTFSANPASSSAPLSEKKKSRPHPSAPPPPPLPSHPTKTKGDSKRTVALLALQRQQQAREKKGRASLKEPDQSDNDEDEGGQEDEYEDVSTDDYRFDRSTERLQNGKRPFRYPPPPGPMSNFGFPFGGPTMAPPFRPMFHPPFSMGYRAPF